MREYDSVINYDWELRGRKHQYWYVGRSYKSAHDNKTYVGIVETNHHWNSPWIYDIKFHFKTRKAAEVWVLNQKPKVVNQLKRYFSKKKLTN